MKLDFETNAPSLSYAGNLTGSYAQNNLKEASEILQAGIKAAQEGNQAEARALLLQVTEAEPENENAWLWLASISEYPEELLIFLNNVLAVNPDNERAQEWIQGTKSLLSGTFVKRGIEAVESNQKVFGKQCFLQAIVHDDLNEKAWMQLAAIADTQEEKASYLQKVLNINPENEDAAAALKAARHGKAEALLRKANSAAIAGEIEAAARMLGEVLNQSPEFEDAWILKAYLAKSFSDKIACYEKVLSLNPENEMAKAGLTSLREMMAKACSEDTSAVSEVFEDEEIVASADEAEQEDIDLFDDNEAAANEEIVSETVQYFNEDRAEEISFDSQVGEESKFAAEDLPTQKLELPDYFRHEETDLQLPAQENDDQETQFDSVILEELEEAKEEQPQVTEQNSENTSEIFEEEGEDVIEVVDDSIENFIEDYSLDAKIPQPDGVLPSYYGEDVFTLEAPAAAATDHSLPESAPEREEVFSDSAEKFFAPESVENENNFFVLENEVIEEEEFTAHAEEEDFVSEDDFQAQAEVAACCYCFAENELKTVACYSCRAILTLDDLERLLANTQSDREILRQAVERMEAEKNTRAFSAEELKTLAVGYINLKDLKQGFSYLRDAAKANPNDFLLNSQLNTLKIRLMEIEEQENLHNSMPKGRTILVVDDSATVRKLVSGKLEKSGHEVVCAVDGIDALEKIKQMVPDLVLLDITMPRMDGYQVCKLIRTNAATKDVPIVMISGKDGFFDKVRGRMAGTTGYITKPFGPETLMKTVEAYIA